MPEFVDLQRRFCPLDKAELEDVEQLSLADKYGFGTSVGWNELLKHARVVLLAEAGSGKTKEMDQQVKRLVGAGQFALFIPLEGLAKEPLSGLLEPPAAEMLEEWCTKPDAPGWFFLDSVDELKLTDGKFDRALLRLAQQLHGHTDRARVLVSCRPSDWNSDLDLGAFQRRLPPPQPRDRTSSRSGDDVFLQALAADGATTESSMDADEEADRQTVLTVVMLPLDRDQIAVLAKSADVCDPDRFLTEVAQRNAWDFVRRPLDLLDLIEVWKASGELGARAKQLETNVLAKLREGQERPRQDVLTDANARNGAERLAFALAHMGCRTIRSPVERPDPVRMDGVLGPETVLRDWTPAERQALLSRALFDPATYGRIRFHHRSVQEYLAARYLRRLNGKGVSTRNLFRLLFDERHGIRIVRPSMRAIAAWAALWDDDVRREICAREPEILLSLGDPETLTLEARAGVLRAFVRAYGQGGWRGLSVPIDEVGRFADPDLAEVIRECWDVGAANKDVGELLIELIWLGPVKDCADFALAAARDPACSPRSRLTAMRALLACGDDDGARTCADSMLADSTSWPDDVIDGAAADLFPKFLGVDELIGLIRQDARKGQVGRGFESAVWKIATAVDSSSSTVAALRDALAELIWETRAPDLQLYHVRGACARLAPALALLCWRQLTGASAHLDDPLLRACVIAWRFGRGMAGWYESAGKLRELFKTDATRRRGDVFWAELAFVDEAATGLDSRDRFYHAQHDSLVGRLTETDRPWLQSALMALSRPDRRAVALHALVQLWRDGGRASSELHGLRLKVQGDDALEELLTKWTASPSEAVIRERDRTDREHAEIEREREEQASKVRASWRQWRDEVQGNPDQAFAPENLTNTLFKLHGWLRRHSRDRNLWDVWDRAALVQVFGEDIAARAETALRALWRKTEPVLWSRRADEVKNAVPAPAWQLGLMGLSAEALGPGWDRNLSPDEARIAVVYATIELNGFAPFLSDLVQSHRSVVEEVLGGELCAELEAGGDHVNLPTLSDLAYADSHIKRVFMSRVIAGLERWPDACTEQNRQVWAHRLNDALRVLTEAQTPSERKAIAQECERRYQSDPTGTLALQWLTGLFRADAARGAELLIETLAVGEESVPRERAVELVAGLFGDRDLSLLAIEGPSERARVLARLVRCAYAHVRREDDQVHDGPYSPDMRDNAETGRGFLLSALCDIPGAETCQTLLEFADEKEFAAIGDRLRLLARERAAADAEEERGRPEDIVALEDQLETPARDGASLFGIMMDRLHDLDHDYRHDDFSIRALLRNFHDESELRTVLAGRLRDHANDVYSVTQEEEVADAKRTDIRLHVPEGDRKAVIEVKIADNWSVSDLRTALRAQLVGRYLRHVSCRHGCLLLAFHGQPRKSEPPRRYWIHPDTHQRLGLADVAALLKEEARSLEAESTDGLRIEIFLLDLSDTGSSQQRSQKSHRNSGIELI